MPALPQHWSPSGISRRVRPGISARSARGASFTFCACARWQGSWKAMRAARGWRAATLGMDARNSVTSRVFAEKAAALSRKTKSFSEFLAVKGLGASPGKVEATVTYHDPCHLSNRFAKVTAQPRALLKSLPGITYKEMPEADWCCGAAGSYTFLHHTEAAGVLDRKMDNVGKTGATVLATECPACMMHLSYGVRRRGLPVQVKHVSQMLDEAYAGPPAH